MNSSTIEPRTVPDPDYAAHERRASLPGYLPAVCVSCSAALQVPEGTTVPMCPGCEEDAGDALGGERFDGME